MTTKTKKRLAAAVGMLVGLASVIAGSRVLLGISQPAYTVILSLVIYIEKLSNFFFKTEKKI
ncbi:hypothetical protein L0337_25790 [candidate division KSB1 bacterium]|nr:hypothetical protein [candidate division KSB1 bacterium]